MEQKLEKLAQTYETVAKDPKYPEETRKNASARAANYRADIAQLKARQSEVVSVVPASSPSSSSQQQPVTTLERAQLLSSTCLVVGMAASQYVARLMMIAKYISEYCTGPGRLDPACEAIRRALMARSSWPMALAEIFDLLFNPKMDSASDLVVTEQAKRIMDEMLALARQYEAADDELLAQVRKLQKITAAAASPPDADRARLILWQQQRIPVYVTWAFLLKTIRTSGKDVFDEIALPQPLDDEARRVMQAYGWQATAFNGEAFFSDPKRGVFVNDLNREALMAVRRAVLTLTPRFSVAEYFCTKERALMMAKEAGTVALMTTKEVGAVALVSPMVITKSALWLSHCYIHFATVRIGMLILVAASAADIVMDHVGSYAFYAEADSMGVKMIDAFIAASGPLRWINSTKSVCVMAVLSAIWEGVYLEKLEAGPPDNMSEFRKSVRETAEKASLRFADILDGAISRAEYATISPAAKRVDKIAAAGIRSIPYLIGLFAYRHFMESLRVRRDKDYVVHKGGAAPVEVAAFSDLVRDVGDPLFPPAVTAVLESTVYVSKFFKLPEDSPDNVLINNFAIHLAEKYPRLEVADQQRVGPITPGAIKKRIEEIQPGYLADLQRRVDLFRLAPPPMNVTNLPATLAAFAVPKEMQQFYNAMSQVEQFDLFQTFEQASTTEGQVAGPSTADSVILNYQTPGLGFRGSMAKGIRSTAPNVAATMTRQIWARAGPYAFSATVGAVALADQFPLATQFGANLFFTGLSLTFALKSFSLSMIGTPVGMVMWIATIFSFSGLVATTQLIIDSGTAGNETPEALHSMKLLTGLLNNTGMMENLMPQDDDDYFALAMGQRKAVQTEKSK